MCTAIDDADQMSSAHSYRKRRISYILETEEACASVGGRVPTDRQYFGVYRRVRVIMVALSDNQVITFHFHDSSYAYH